MASISTFPSNPARTVALTPMTSPGKSAKLIAFVNLKGGTGKTTLAQNLAACLARLHHQRILCIDLDPQGNLGQGLFSEPGNYTRTADRLLLVPKPRVSEYIISLRPGLDLIPNRYQHEIHENVEKMPLPWNLLRDKLSAVLSQYDYVILDTPAGLSTSTRVAIDAADEVIIVISCGVYALRGSSMMVAGIGDFCAARHKQSPALRVVLNNYDERRRFDRQFRLEVEHIFGSDLFRTSIRPSVSIAEAAAASRPVIEYKAHSPGARDFRKLSHELLGLPYEEEAEDEAHARAQQAGFVIKLVS